MPIRILSDQLASQIAAGEVVERPSSVVKELVENSIDAGATTINVDVRQAGRQSIQVADDGGGISAAEMETAFLRHATSKLATVDDLNAIGTLGFRGEALAAIAAVSQVTVISRAADENAGQRLVLEGGVLRSRETVGAPQGTVIGVDNLFFNVPARLKFLKSDTTERRLIDEIVTRYALAYPQIRFRLTHNGRISFQSNGTGNVRDVLLALHGPEIARLLLPLDDAPAEDAIAVAGFVGPPSVHYANRNQIIFFVNGRWVKDNSLTYAVIQAYNTLLPTGRYPLGLIFMTLPPQQVDVNVHPTKTEIRFRQGKTPFSLVQRAVRAALLAAAPPPGSAAWAMGGYAEPTTPGWEGSLDGAPFAATQSEFEMDWMATAPDETQPLPGAGEASGQLPLMRVVGQVGAAYIIAEGPDGLFLVDQQAADERIAWERLQAALVVGAAPRHELTAGTAVTLSPTQTDLINTHQETLAQLGFAVEPFGPQAFMLRAVPQPLAQRDPAQALLAVLAGWEQMKSGEKTAVAVAGQRICRSAAVRPGQTLSSAEMQRIIQQLEQCQDPFTAPDGRPTFIYLSVAQLAREFGHL